MATVSSLSPLEQERNEFGYNIVEIRGKPLRVIHRPRHVEEAQDSDQTGGTTTTRVFFVHGGGGRGCQFKHQMKALET